jgi:hypothetical protein
MATLGDIYTSHERSGFLPDLRSRWNLTDSDDPGGCLDRVRLLWRDWLPEERDLLLDCIEKIARAERIRRHLDVRLTRRQRDLAGCVVSAARLASDLCATVSDRRSAVWTVCDALDQFALTAFHVLTERMPVDAYIDARVALSVLKSRDVGKRVSTTFLAELVRAALGTHAGFDHRTMRRYERPGAGDWSRIPTARIWKRREHWALLRRAAKRHPAGDDEQLAAELRSYLQPDGETKPRTKRGRKPSHGVIHSDRLDEAHRYRDQTKLELLEAKRQGTGIYGRVLASLAKSLNLTPEAATSLLRKIAKSGKPSEAGARFAAAKYGLPLRAVRTQKAPTVASSRRARPVVAVPDVAAVEAAVEAARRGRASKTR